MSPERVQPWDQRLETRNGVLTPVNGKRKRGEKNKRFVRGAGRATKDLRHLLKLISHPNSLVSQGYRKPTVMFSYPYLHSAGRQERTNRK